jgi:hypothetical protein
MGPNPRRTMDYGGAVEAAAARQHSTVGADRMIHFTGPADPEITRRKSFLQSFAASKGPPQIVMLIVLLALGFGSTIGVVRMHSYSY